MIALVQKILAQLNQEVHLMLVDFASTLMNYCFSVLMINEENIGTYSFDVTTVYFKEKHCIQHQYVALFNPDGEDFSQVTGYL